MVNTQLSPVAVVTAVFALGLAAPACLDGDLPGLFVPPTADQDPRLPQLEIEVAGHRRVVHLETHGRAGDPVLLVLHGSLNDYRSLRPLAALADEGYFVVLWDQRGNGLSERVGADEVGEAAILEEIAAIKAEFAPDATVSLVGHSFGAMYAALYASRHPEQVDKLALLEPAGLTGEIFTATFDDIFNLDLFDPSVAQVAWQNELLGALDHEQMDYKALMLLESGTQLDYYCDPGNPPTLPIWRPGAYYDLIRNGKLQPKRAGRFEFDYASGLEVFPQPVLLIGSECSALGWEFQERYHVELFGEAEVVRIADAGHRLIVEQTGAVLAALRDYF